MSGDQALLDLLSEMIAVERDGMRLYVGFLDDAPEQERARLRDYAEQSRRAVLILEEASGASAATRSTSRRARRSHTDSRRPCSPRPSRVRRTAGCTACST